MSNHNEYNLPQSNYVGLDNTTTGCTKPTRATQLENSSNSMDVSTLSITSTQGKELHWPPGVAGEIAKYIYHSSYLPVREVAIAATLGLLAGVCGRAFVTETGKSLSLYIILVAHSGIGKEGMHEGIHKLINSSDEQRASSFLLASDVASGPALHKAILKQPGFLSLQGEFGRKLKRMTNPKDTPMQELRTLLTNAYAKDWLEGKIYSDSDNTMTGVKSPALSLLGETTPNTFYEALTPDMMADGFMSRFLVISYEGERPQSNNQRLSEMPSDLKMKWNSIIKRALPHQTLLNTPAPTAVKIDHDDLVFRLTDFENECRDAINASNDETQRHAWNRAHLKVLQIASLLAVADNSVNPILKCQHVIWARDTVKMDIEMFLSRIEKGDIGADDHTRERKLCRILYEYLTAPLPKSYGVPNNMKLDVIVPRAYLQKRTAQVTTFNSHKSGSAHALNLTIKSLIDNGHIQEINKSTLINDYGFHGKCYRILKDQY